MPVARTKSIVVIAVLVASNALSGCYYAQAARGQLEVLNKREPIAEIVGDPATDAALAERLRFVQRARRFSIDSLGLPDNRSYQSYSDLERDFVVWNVFAAEEFSLSPRQWCYPVVGCVSYRGYFREAAARREAEKLEARGLDVYMGGVAAYSTLGKFDDPVLNTMMRWDDVQLASVLFHELAHQVLYVKDDTAFNESFATAVEEFGIERFLRAEEMEAEFERYEKSKAFRREMMTLAGAARKELQALFDEELALADKRARKTALYSQLETDLKQLYRDNDREAGSWLSAPLNNARLAPFALYEGRLPEFRVLLERCGDQLPCFYEEALRLAELRKSERDAYLDALVTGEQAENDGP